MECRILAEASLSKLKVQLRMADMLQAAREQLGDMLIVQAHEDLPALLAGAHHALISQAAQLVRDGGLAETEELDQVADVHLSGAQGSDDAHPSRIAQRLEQAGDLLRSLLIQG